MVLGFSVPTGTINEHFYIHVHFCSIIFVASMKIISFLFPYSRMLYFVCQWWPSWTVLCKSHKFVTLGQLEEHSRIFFIIFMITSENWRLNQCLTFIVEGLGLWCLTPLSTIFQSYRGSKFFGFTWRKPPLFLI
jgi:hypothetical protein